ncbi:MAG: 2Fe-2S iron-sulfur cluster-binding protein [Pseudomonadota bacterium]|nr:2Fe-2S iron-sulfur cluster-binding protein [Pseudomonadota bacterium]
MRISLSNSDRSFSAAADQSLLDAALDASLNLPHSCRGGNCGSCRARLVQGDVCYPHGRPLGLSDAEVAEGFILLCQARAQSDVCIETFEISTPETAVIKRLPARIERALPLSHDVMGVFLRLPAAEMFSFEPGQHVDILLPGGRRRSFSIASPPHDSRVLELHVWRVPGGAFSEQLFSPGRSMALLNIEGPLGQFVYPPKVPAAPLLLIGGGTGLAPLLSILRHVVENGIERDIAMYWGVRSERDLYAQARLEALAARGGRVRYIPVLSEPAAAWGGSRGLAHEAALRDIADLTQHQIYAAGPPAMMEAVRREFGARGVGADRLFLDSFDYAPDALTRQRTSAVTKS